jgi:DNA polymerase-3 subunit delta'
LLSARSDTLLDTIRSRSLPIRFGPLSDDVLRRILSARDVDAKRVDGLLELAGGSASVALAAADPEQSERRSALVQSVIAAVSAPTLADGVALSESLDSDRRMLADDLRALAGFYVREARRAVAGAPAVAATAAERHALVLDAIDSVERNGAAALALTSLIASLRHVRQRRPGTKPPIVVQRR